MNYADHQSAVARVIARGSNPSAIAEAEGDFGPDGTFSLDGCPAGRTDPHQCDCVAPPGRTWFTREDTGTIQFTEA